MSDKALFWWSDFYIGIVVGMCLMGAVCVGSAGDWLAAVLYGLAGLVSLLIFFISKKEGL